MRTSRRLPGVLAATLLLGTLGVLPAAAQHVEARSLDSACADAPEDDLQDTGTDGGELESAVDCIAWYEVTRGVTETEYRPALDVRRGQMAAFLARVMRPSNTVFEEPAENEDHFTDDDGGVFEDDINFVAKHGVADGFTATTYAPTRSVTRAQMARFLVNLLDAIGATLPEPSQDYFTDDDGGIFEDDINTIAEVGIATGFTDTEYRPTRNVNRGQMARFLGRSLAELVDQDLLLTPAQREVQVALDSTEVERGDDVSGSITSGSEPQAAVVNGCGLTDEALEDGDAVTDGIQFSATIPSDQDLGGCTLAFDVDLANGQTVPVEVAITVEDERDAVVLLDQRSIQQGQQLTGSIIPDEGVTISSAEVSGCGLTDVALSDQDAEAEGIQFAVTIPNSTPTGTCDLTFTVQYAALGILPGGGEDTFVETIRVLAGSGVFTGAPELVGLSAVTSYTNADCTTQAASGDQPTHVLLGLTFDEAITGRSVPQQSAGFELVGYDGARATATAARLHATNDRIAEACFPADAHTNATTVTVARDTVGDAGNLGNPEGAVGVKDVTLSGTTAPEVVSGQDLAGDAYRFTFDEDVTVANGDRFRLVAADGTLFTSTTASATASANTVDATFGGSDGVVVRRIAALNGAVTSVADGDANVVTVHRVASGGATSGPDLAGVTYHPGATRTRDDTTVQVDEVRFTFDVSVLEQPGNTNRFEVIAADGTRTQPEAVDGAASDDPVVRSSQDGRVVIVEFPDGTLETTTIATVYSDAVRAAGGSQPINHLDALARSPQLSYTRGTTIAPAVVSATVTSSSTLLGTTYTVRVTFDEVVDPDTIASGSISLYDDQGRRFTIAGQPARDGDDPNVIEVTSTMQTGTNAAIGDAAVLVGVAPGAVTDPQGNPSHAQATAL